MCYSKFLNPFENCIFRKETEERRRRALSISEAVIVKRTSVKCLCPFDNINGFYKDVSGVSHQFSRPNPPICNQCIVEAYGYKPLENPSGSFTKPCTIWGSFDPNYANLTLAWRPCADHGQWNGTACNCNKGWALGDAMEGKDATEEVYVCNVCAVPFGPLVLSNAAGAPFCTKIYSPNEYGVPQECGGKGLYLYGSCQCQHGYNLIAYEGYYTCG